MQLHNFHCTKNCCIGCANVASPRLMRCMVISMAKFNQEIHSCEAIAPRLKYSSLRPTRSGFDLTQRSTEELSSDLPSRMLVRSISRSISSLVLPVIGLEGEALTASVDKLLQHFYLIKCGIDVNFQAYNSMHALEYNPIRLMMQTKKIYRSFVKYIWQETTGKDLRKHVSDQINYCIFYK